jgi:hypothetical protein
MATQVQNIKIDTIKTKILRPALTSHYMCEFEFPQNEPFFGNFIKSRIAETLSLSCCEASLPGSSIATHDLNNDFTGVTQRHAYRRLYDDRADFTFYVNNTYEQIGFFEAWMRYITGEQVGTVSDWRDTTKFYRIQYPINYKASLIKITKFERDAGGEILGGNSRTIGNLAPNQIQYVFTNAFPSNINSMPISYDGGQLLKCTVSFIYDRYICIGSAKSSPAKAFIPELKRPRPNIFNQPQPSIPASVAQNPYLQSQFNISQFAYSSENYSNSFNATNEPLF